MSEERKKILKLGQKITDRIGHKVTVEDPEYWGLACVVTDEMADVALKMKVRRPMTLPQLVQATGKDAGQLEKLLQDMRLPFTEEQVKKETARCLGCGASVVDPNRCIGCGVCTTKCEFDAIHLFREHPEASHMMRSEDKLKAILPYMVKREIKIKRAARKK